MFAAKLILFTALLGQQEDLGILPSISDMNLIPRTAKVVVEMDGESVVKKTIEVEGELTAKNAAPPDRVSVAISELLKPRAALPKQAIAEEALPLPTAETKQYIPPAKEEPKQYVPPTTVETNRAPMYSAPTLYYYNGRYHTSPPSVIMAPTTTQRYYLPSYNSGFGSFGGFGGSFGGSFGASCFGGS